MNWRNDACALHPGMSGGCATRVSRLGVRGQEVGWEVTLLAAGVVGRAFEAWGGGLDERP